MSLSKLLLTLSTTTLLSVSSALAQQNAVSSPIITTPLDLEQCHFLTNEELGLAPLSEEEAGMGSAAWLCIGYNRSIIYVAEGDLRMFVSHGANAMQEIAAHQTLPPFNNIGNSIEWRLGADNLPIASIHSLHTESGERAEIKGEVLVVTKIEPGNTCHIAYIDVNMPVLANQNYDPHQIARDFADQYASQFNCATDDILMVPS